MIINFNIEKLDALLLDFYKITKMTISVWDANFNQLSYQPRDMPIFCQLIKSTKTGKQRCLESDKKICSQCLQNNQPCTHRCHAGLIDTAIPIKFQDRVLGFLMFGQAAPPEANEQLDPLLKSLSKELNLDKSLLYQAHANLIQYQPDITQSAANILKAATQYLWLSGMIRIENEYLIEQIDEYIHANIRKKISIDSLCKQFNMSKNKLYTLFSKHMKTSVGNYVMKVRIDTAKNLLTTTDLPVYIICDSIGISEYNYFTKIFKRITGLTPLQYRKRFPLSLPS